MKKAKNGKKDKTFKPDSPVTYNRSIMAAFDKQNKGKVCPMCNVKFSLATYRLHMNECQVDENDEEIEVIASYSREEAINLRAGAEIVLGEEEIIDSPVENRKSPEISETSKNVKNPETPKNSPKRRRTEDAPEPENAKTPSPPQMVPFSFDTPNAKTPGPSEPSKQAEIPANLEKPLKTSPEWDNRRRSRRIARKSPEIPQTVVKKETATISEVLEAIKRFEDRIASSPTPWPFCMRLAVKILKKVISTRKSDDSWYSDDFWKPEDIISMYRFVEELSESAKCIMMRLVIRRPGWYHLEKLEQKYQEIPDIGKAVVELTKWGFFEDDSCLKDLDEALILSDLTVLKNVARKFKLDTTKNRQETVQLIKKCAFSQKSIFGGVGNMEASIIRAIKQELGTCVRIRPEPVLLFKALYTIYCPVSTNSSIVIDNAKTNPYQDLIFLMTELDQGKVRFPAPNPNENIASFYKDRDMLTSYITAKSIETTLITFMSDGRLSDAFDLADDSRRFVESITDEVKEYYEKLEIHERKFTAIWVLTRCVAHGATILEKQKKWGMAVEAHRELLLGEDYKHYCLDHRGVWWDRLLLNLDSHLKEKKECLKYALLALQDPHVLDKELLLIQDRILKLKDVPADFRPKISIGTPEKRTISAPIITKNLADGRVNRFLIQEEREDGIREVECSVEEVVRRRYLEEEGFERGIHDEGATWHTLFGLLFYDIIFNSTHPSTQSTWFSEVQDSPADLANTLYSKRKELFEERFKWVQEAKDEEIEEVIRDIWEKKGSGEVKEANKECAWKMFQGGVEECLAFYHCVPRPALIAICRRLATDYRNCRSGFPDLTMWNTETKQVAVIEVKGPGDRLSTKQRLWLAFFADHGIRAEVCHVTAESSKRLS